MSSTSLLWITVPRWLCRILFPVLLCSFIVSNNGAAFVSKNHGAVFRRGSYTHPHNAQSVDDFEELPLDFPRREDVLIALSAVRKACEVTNNLQPDQPEEISTVTKQDLSPVTVADYAAQALVLDHLHQAFPNDSFVAEESSTALVEDVDLAQQILTVTSLSNLDHLKTSIDLGKDYLNWEERGGRPPRVWCLDPIDGTKGFLRGKPQGGQYCVALALLEVRGTMHVQL